MVIIENRRKGMDKEKQEITQNKISRYFSELQFRINIYNKTKKETYAQVRIV